MKIEFDHIGRKVSFRDRLRWVRLEKQWWPCILYGDYRELMLDIHPDDKEFRAFCFCKYHSYKGVLVYLLGHGNDKRTEHQRRFFIERIPNLPRLVNADDFEKFNGDGQYLRNYFDFYEEIIHSDSQLYCTDLDWSNIVQYNFSSTHPFLVAVHEVYMGLVRQSEMDAMKLTTTQSTETTVIQETPNTFDLASKVNYHGTADTSSGRFSSSAVHYMKESNKRVKVTLEHYNLMHITSPLPRRITLESTFDAVHGAELPFRRMGQSTSNEYASHHMSESNLLASRRCLPFGTRMGQPTSNQDQKEDISSTSKDSIHSCDDWHTVWDKLKRVHGWSWKGGCGLVSYYYIKPNGKVKGGKEGIDYFTLESDVQEYARLTYGWDPRPSNSSSTDPKLPIYPSPSLSSSWSPSFSSERLSHDGYIAESLTDENENDGDHCDDGDEIHDDNIRADDEWHIVWDKLKRVHGWSWKGGCGLVSYYYIKPNGKVKGGKEGIDYFTLESDVQEYARLTYGWDPRPSNSSSTDPKLPIYPSCENENDGDHDDDSAGDEMHDDNIRADDEWHIVWDKLKRVHGWSWKGGCGLVSYYYIKPNGKVKGGKEGIDYFTLESDVQEYARLTYGWDPRPSNSSSTDPKLPTYPSCENENDGDHDDDSAGDEMHDDNIRADDEWHIVWDKLKRVHGWSWKGGCGLVSYYYIKPNGKVKGGKEGIDYFTLESDVQEYARLTYGWDPRPSNCYLLHN